MLLFSCPGTSQPCELIITSFFCGRSAGTHMWVTCLRPGCWSWAGSQDFRETNHWPHPPSACKHPAVHTAASGLLLHHASERGDFWLPMSNFSYVVNWSHTWHWKNVGWLVQPRQATQHESPHWRCCGAQLQLCSTLAPSFPHHCYQGRQVKPWRKESKDPKQAFLPKGRFPSACHPWAMTLSSFQEDTGKSLQCEGRLALNVSLLQSCTKSWCSNICLIYNHGANGP